MYCKKKKIIIGWFARIPWQSNENTHLLISPFQNHEMNTNPMFYISPILPTTHSPSITHTNTHIHTNPHPPARQLNKAFLFSKYSYYERPNENRNKSGEKGNEKKKRKEKAKRTTNEDVVY